MNKDERLWLLWWTALAALAIISVIFTGPLEAEDGLSVPSAKTEKLGNPEFYKNDFCSVKKLDNGDKVITLGNAIAAVLEDFFYYRQNGKLKLKLISKLGFSLGNIPADPADNIYFFNESVATFLEGEKLLPLAKKWLTDNNYAGRDLAGLIFSFPDNPLIDAKNGYTHFSYQAWVKSGYWSGRRWQRYWVDTSHWETNYVLGLTDYAGASHAVVTYGYNKKRSIIVHEYIHMCGYGSKYHDRHIFAEGGVRKTYNKS